MKKVKPKVKTYKVIQEAVVSGIAFGINRAFKYAEDDPTEESLKLLLEERIELEVMNALCEVMDFGDD